MFTEYLRAVLLIFAAEMGDKTQILAMMFATKYPTKKVLIGIGIGSFLNHGIAVLFGSILGRIIPIYVLQMIAGIAFIAFALWTLINDDDEEVETEKSSKRSAIIVVAAAFFLGELGDKTQLTAITLSVDASFPIFILLGTVTGMLLTSSLGIFVGSKIGDRIPEILIKLVSSCIFLIFGSLKLLAVTPSHLINIYTLSVFVLVVTGIVLMLVRTLIIAHREGHLSPYRRASKALYNHAHKMSESVNDICRGVKHCGQCQGNTCAIGFLKGVTKDIKENDLDLSKEQLIEKIQIYEGKFNHEKLMHCLQMNMAYMATLKVTDSGFEASNLMRKVLEILLIGQVLDYRGTISEYKKILLEKGIEL